MLDNRRAAQLCLFILGLAILALGTSGMSEAAQNGQITYNDQRVTEVVNGLLTYMEGSFGAIIMVFCGLFTICAAAFGQYRVAIGLMVVAIGSFTLRSFMSTFFNDVNITNGAVPGSGTVNAAGETVDKGNYAARHVKAVDVFVPSGTRVLAYQSGEVTSTGTKGKCGNYVVLSHEDGTTTVYCHLDQISVRTGETVAKGSSIATVGSTGMAANTRPHLHFEVRRDGKSEDARRYLKDVEWQSNGRAKDLAPLKGQLVYQQGAESSGPQSATSSSEEPSGASALASEEPVETTEAVPGGPESEAAGPEEEELIPSDDYVSF